MKAFVEQLIVEVALEGTPWASAGSCAKVQPDVFQLHTMQRVPDDPILTFSILDQAKLTSSLPLVSWHTCTLRRAR